MTMEDRQTAICYLALTICSATIGIAQPIALGEFSLMNGAFCVIFIITLILTIAEFRDSTNDD